MLHVAFFLGHETNRMLPRTPYKRHQPFEFVWSLAETGRWCAAIPFWAPIAGVSLIQQPCRLNLQHCLGEEACHPNLEQILTIWFQTWMICPFSLFKWKTEKEVLKDGERVGDRGEKGSAYSRGKSQDMVRFWKLILKSIQTKPRPKKHVTCYSWSRDK